MEIKPINLKEKIRDTLLEIEGVNSVAMMYPKEWNTLPIIIFKTRRRNSFRNGNGGELLTGWTIEVEVYSDGDPTDIAEAVYDKLTNLGFNGVLQDSNLKDFNRILGTFKGVMDNVSKTIHIR